MAAWDDFVLVGHIARPHGHRGQVIVTPRTDFAAERFAPGATIWVLRKGVPTALVIQDARFHKERPVLTLDGPQEVVRQDGQEKHEGGQSRGASERRHRAGWHRSATI